MALSPVKPPRKKSPPLAPWQLGGDHSWDFRSTLVMGVLNATPDSFSDGGDFLSPEEALRHAWQMMEEGAHIIDLGGASSHPKAAAVSPERELARVLPVVERLVREIPLPISIDTQQPTVAEACLRAGAHLINDVSGLCEGAMAGVAARHGVPLVIMFNNFNVPLAPTKKPLPEAIADFFLERIALAEAEGAKKLILDPGYGFGKSLEENLTLLRTLPGLVSLGRPLLICTSRKGSLGRITGEKAPRERLGATLASTLFAIEQGVHMVRVHDVKPLMQAIQTWQAIRDPREG